MGLRQNTFVPAVPLVPVPFIPCSNRNTTCPERAPEASLGQATEGSAALGSRKYKPCPEGAPEDPANDSCALSGHDHMRPFSEGGARYRELAPG